MRLHERISQREPLGDIERFGLEREVLSRRVALAGVALGVVATVCQVVAHALNGAVLGGDVEALNADTEGNVFTWAAAAAVFAAALACFLRALLSPSRRAEFAALALILTVFSADDVARFHEHLNRRGHSWTVWAAPLLAVALVLLLRVAHSMAARNRRLVLIGMALLAVAVAMETLQRLWLDGDDEGSARWWVSTGIEESAELLGWCLVATALLASLVAYLVQAAVAAARRPRLNGW